MIKNVLACFWMVVVGSNVAQFYSQDFPYQGIVVFFGGLVFLLAYRSELFGLLQSKDFAFMLIALALPIGLMFVSDRSFDRGDYASMLSVVLIFMVSAVLVSRKELKQAVIVSSFIIVLVGTALNLYELLIENNVWSIAPGRSAGFYVNPTLAGEALVAFGLAFLLMRTGKLSLIDLVLIFVTMVGVLSTFSRSAILASIVLFFVAAFLRTKQKHILRTISWLLFSVIFVSLITSYVVSNVDLSEDASIRIFSLLDKGGVGDYKDDRGHVAEAGVVLALNDPLFGVGVRTIFSMEEGPHNIFVAVLIDYGLVGLAYFLAMIARLIYVSFRVGLINSALVFSFVGWVVLFGFGSHTLLGSAATMVWFGFAFSKCCEIQKSKFARLTG